MKLSEYRGEQAVEILADLIDPFAEIFTDDVLHKAFDDPNMKRQKIASMVLKRHKGAILQIICISEGKDPKTYKPNAFEILRKSIDLLNDPDVQSLFTLQAQREESVDSVPVSESITE